MPNIVETKKYVLSSIDVNSNKVWQYELYDDNSVVCKWGRVGKGMQSKTFSGGKHFAEGKVREKIKKGYREVAVVGASSTSSSEISVAKNNLKDIATKQIEHSCPTVKKLIEYLTKVNAHQIYVGSKGAITYNDSTGLFQTPIGIVSKESIDEARQILANLSNYVSKKMFDSPKMSAFIEDYLMLVPQEVGRKLTASSFLPDLAAIYKQNDILDGLEASYASAISTPLKINDNQSVDEPKIFNVKLDRLNDDKEIDRIKKKYISTQQRMHVSSRLKVTDVYTVEIDSMARAFENGKKVGNVMELWHGTKSSACLSIMKQGFIIPPSNASHCTGRLYGNGVYGAPASSKAANYALSYWGGRDEGRYFMFLVNMAMGKTFVPKNYYGHYPVPGHDSTWAKGGVSGVINDECIVYKLNQINPVYFIELTYK